MERIAETAVSESPEPPFESRGINSWLLRMANAEPHKAVLEGLAHKGILSKRKRKYKLVFPEARERIIERAQKVIREDDPADEQTAALVALLVGECSS